MSVRRPALATLLFIGSAAGALAEPAPDHRSEWPRVQKDLESMEDDDQAVRIQLGPLHGKADAARAKALIDRMVVLDRKNQERLAAIVNRTGWPTISRVGARASAVAFLIVQHAPLDYQLKYLPLIRAAVAAGEQKPSQLALLEDRILLRQGRPQRYGSQVNTSNGIRPFPIEDEANLDKRRAEVGLKPVAEYIQQVRAMYGGKGR